MHLQSRDGVAQALHLPLASSVVRHIEPAFIQRYDPSGVLRQLQELHAALHSLDQAPVRVGVYRYLDHLAVAHI